MTTERSPGLQRALPLAILAVWLPVCAGAGEGEAAPAEAAQAPESRLGRFGEDTRVSAEEFQFSEAERMLWMSDHMTHADSQPGTTLYYTFTRESVLGDGFEDEVRMQILKAHADGTKDVSVRFFGDQRQQPVFYPENLSQVRGNPVLGLYLQGDVQDMNRMTDGSWRYFQRLIKSALAEDATVEPIEVQYDGRNIAARRITIRPYDNDPKKVRYLKFADKSYEFVLSEAIPGKIYSIRTVVSEPGNKDSSLVEERLIFRGLDADAGSS